MKLKIITLCIFTSLHLFAEEFDLDLKKVIELSKNPSFEQKSILFDMALDDLKSDQLTNNYYPNLYLDTQIGSEQNLIAGENDVQNDNFAYIVWKNNLYNSQDNLKNSTIRDNKELKQLKLNESFQKRKIVAMQSFFDTHLASMYHQYVLELLAMNAIYKDRLTDVEHLGRTSDVDILQKEAIMQLSSAKNYKAEQEFFLKKQKLADLLGVDFYAIKSLKKPDLKYYLEKKILKSDELKTLAFKNDPYLLQLIQESNNITSQIKRIDSSYDININSTVMVGYEEQKTVDSDENRYEARINLVVPLFDGNQNNNKISRLYIKQKKIQNAIEEYKQQLSQKIESLLVALNFQKRMIKATSINLDYQNLYLEKSRIRYQQDRSSDLGDSLALLSKAEYEYAKAIYDYVINYENLNLLTGVNNETK